jgi:hypothetical protein
MLFQDDLTLRLSSRRPPARCMLFEIKQMRRMKVYLFMQRSVLPSTSPLVSLVWWVGCWIRWVLMLT